MSELLTAAQMRAIEEAAIASGEVTGLELMERAGAGVVEAIFEEWPELATALVDGAERGPAPSSIGGSDQWRNQGRPPGDLGPEKGQARRAVVLCGPGNNGGDGFVVARLLKESGWDVEVFLYGDAEKLPRDARVNYERWREVGEVQLLLSKLDCTEKYDLLIDALFGAGLTRGLQGEVAQLADFLADFPEDRPGRPLRWMKDRTVAIDFPSGSCSASGYPLGDRRAFEAALTVTFHTAKPGHYLGLGASSCGKIVIADIGLGGTEWLSDFRLLDFDELEFELSDLLERYGRHKYSHGHALIFSGGAGRTGAARLAARGALRIGAGLVTIGVPGSAQLEVAAQVTAIMLRRAGTPEEAAAALEDARINALCLGPGMGVDRARELVPVALRSNRATVLDADALTAFENEPQNLFDLLHESCVLTPHGGEFRRLFPDIAERLNAPAPRGPAYSKVDATRAAAARAGCVVLFKGPDTVIAHPDGRCSVNAAVYERAAPWLATAGSGDVLAGFITGLLARGFRPLQAAETAAWLHVECALSFGPGLIAEDLPEELPKVFRALEV